MPLLLDGDIISGFFRKERPIIKSIIESTVFSRSPMLKNYIQQISKITGLREDIVKNSRPVYNFAKKIFQ